MSLIPAATRLSRQCLITNLLPRGRSCLGCPILFDEPAARRIAVTLRGIFPPVFDNLSHDADSYFLRRYRTDWKTYGSDNSVNICLRESFILESLEEKGLFTLASEKTYISCLCSQGCFQSYEIMIMPTGCNNDKGIWVNRNI